jgi:hypothetical protein
LLGAAGRLQSLAQLPKSPTSRSTCYTVWALAAAVDPIRSASAANIVLGIVFPRLAIHARP